MKPVLDFIKAHTFALACAVVALLGLLAYFVYPVPGWFADLQANVQARKPVYEEINGLLTANRTLPNTDLNATQGAPLDRFPTARITKNGQDLLANLAVEATNTLRVIAERNTRKPLVPEALPTGGPIARNRFLAEYKKAAAQTGEFADQGIVHTVLHGSLPPSAEEVTAIGARRAAQIAQADLVIGANNQPVNQPQVDQKIAAMKAKLPLQLRLQRAYGSQIFVTPGAVEVNPQLFQSNAIPDPVTVFNGQFSLWIQSACFEAIRSANGDAKTVFDAPVKQLILLRVPMSVAQGGTGGAQPGFGAPPGEGGDPAAAAAAAAPVELKPDPTVAITPKFDTDPLGYNHNAFYDPFPVQMVLRVEAAKLPEVLRLLQTGRLFKVKNVQMRSVDLGRAVAEGYLYFEKDSRPLVDVALDCDVLFLRQWLVNYMPNPVKQAFQAMGTGAAAPAPG